MSANLRTASHEEMAPWLAELMVSYVAERVASGDSQSEAEGVAEMQITAAFPGGEPAPGNLLFRVCDDDEAVGWLWIGPRNPAALSKWWVWDVSIDERYRGRGLGRAAMLLAEEAARSSGAAELGLNVFGPNTVARQLYDSLGYETRSLQMNKALNPPG